jgi:hypothetical protein
MPGGRTGRRPGGTKFIMVKAVTYMATPKSTTSIAFNSHARAGFPVGSPMNRVANTIFIITSC